MHGQVMGSINADDSVCYFVGFQQWHNSPTEMGAVVHLNWQKWSVVEERPYFLQVSENPIKCG